MKNVKPVLAASLLCMGLSACGSVDGLKFWRAEKPEPCPKIIVLRDAATLTQFREGPGRDLIDVKFEAEIRDVLNACKYDVDYDTRAGTIAAQVAPIIQARRGPGDNDKRADLTYFVAVADKTNKIQEKNQFNLSLGFPDNLTINQVTDEPVNLTFTTDGSTDGSDYTIYVGFQLTREQMDYNLKLSQR